MNTNLIHNVLNVLIALIAGFTAFMISTGCVQSATGALDCTGSFLPIEYTTITVTVLALAKTLINIFRDGVRGLTKQQPPVK